MAAPCNCLQNFILKQKMQLIRVNSKSLMNFSVGISMLLPNGFKIQIPEMQCESDKNYVKLLEVL